MQEKCYKTCSGCGNPTKPPTQPPTQPSTQPTIQSSTQIVTDKVTDQPTTHTTTEPTTIQTTEPPTTPPCVDLRSAEKCKMYVERGFCFLATGKRKCPKSCGVCGIVRTTVLPTTPSCIDKLPDKCPTWAEGGMCTLGGGSYVQEACR